MHGGTLALKEGAEFGDHNLYSLEIIFISRPGLPVATCGQTRHGCQKVTACQGWSGSLCVCVIPKRGLPVFWTNSEKFATNWDGMLRE